jgi:hypothetical protein
VETDAVRRMVEKCGIVIDLGNLSRSVTFVADG